MLVYLPDQNAKGDKLKLSTLSQRGEVGNGHGGGSGGREGPAFVEVSHYVQWCEPGIGRVLLS